MTNELIEGAPPTPETPGAPQPIAEDQQAQQAYENMLAGVAPPPRPEAPPAPAQQPEPDILEKPLEKITMAEFMHKVYADQPPPAAAAQEEEELPPEEDEYEPMTEDEIAGSFQGAIKTALPYLEDDDVGTLSKLNAQMVKPLADQNFALMEKIKTLESKMAPVLQSMEQQQIMAENVEVKTHMRQIHPDFDQVDPIMQKFYDQYHEEIEANYSFSSLPKPARAEILYGLVKSFAPQPSAPGAPQRPVQAPPQPRRSFSNAPAQSANVSGQAPTKPIDRLWGDVVEEFRK